MQPTIIVEDCCSQSTENGPVVSVQKGSKVRVSGQDGLPKDLEHIPNSIIHFPSSGSVQSADGSQERPISLNLQNLTSAEYVVVVDGNGKVLGKIEPPESDGWLGYFGGRLAFQPFQAPRGEFDQNEILPGTGKIAVIQCGINGKVQLGYLNLTSEDGSIVTLDANGNIVVKKPEEYPTATTGDSLLVMNNGAISVLKPSSNKKIVPSADGTKWELVDNASSGWEFLPSPVTLWSLSHGSLDSLDISINLASLTGYTPNAKMVYLHAKLDAGAQTIRFKTQLKHGTRILASASVNDDYEHNTDSNDILIPIPADKTITLNISSQFIWGSGGTLYVAPDVKLLAWVS